MTPVSDTPTPTREADYETLRAASTFALGPTGYAAQIMPPTHAIFRLIGDAESIPLFLQLIASDSPTPRAYGLFGLFHTDRALFEQAAAPFRNDATPIFYLMGCDGLKFPLNQLIRGWEVSADSPPPRKNFWQRLNSLFSSAK